MRRSLSTALAFILWAASGIPLGAFGPAVQACCRRTGAHHCAAMNGAAVGTTTLVRAHECPFRSSVSLISGQVAASPTLACKSVPSPGLASRLRLRQHAEAAQLSSYAWQGRAPPFCFTPA